MGLHNRDYMRARPLPFSAGTTSPVIWWILGINVVLWVFAAGSFRSQGPLGAFIYGQGTLLPHRVVENFEVWRVFTAFWLHAPEGVSHVLFNMLLLFLMGRAVEARLGTRGFLKLYLACGLASTVLLVFFYLATQKPFGALGASGAVFGILTWLATVEPRRTVFLFGVLPMPLWVLVGVLMVGSQLLGLTDPRKAMEPVVGHLAGAACGFLMARFGRRFALPKSAPYEPKRTPKPTPRSQADPGVRVRVDALLKKIHDEGIGSLSEAEKKFLQEASQRY